MLPRVLIDAVNEELAKNKSGWDPKERPIKMHDLMTKRSWYGDEPTDIKTGDTIPLNWSHEASEKLGKVKSVDFHNGQGLTIKLEATAPNREWIKELSKEVNKKIAEKEWRNILDFDSDITNYVTEQDFDQYFLVPQWRIRTPEEQAQYKLERDTLDACRYASETYRKKCVEMLLNAIYEDKVIYACRHAFENLKLSLRSAQDREIAKYSVKDKSELMTPYDIWE